MLELLISKIRYYDFELTGRIYAYLTPYFPNSPVPYLSQKIPLFIKMGIFSFILLIPTGIAKLKYSESRLVTFLLVALGFALGLTIILIFFGFFQLFYTYP